LSTRYTKWKADAVKACLLEGLGDQAAVFRVNVRHQFRQVDRSVAIGQVEDRVHILACEKMSGFDVDTPEAERR
jgi:hypothetical protein